MRTAVLFFLVGAWPAVAGAEAFLTLGVGGIDASAYPKVTAQLRVTWEAGVRSKPGVAADYGACKVDVRDSGGPAADAAVQFVRGISPAEDRLTLRFTSPHPEQNPRVPSVRMDCAGVHNARGDRFALFGPPATAHVVIAGGAKKAAGAERSLADYRKRGLPQHDDFPKVLDSTFVQGLNPGFFIVAVGLPEDAKVASLLVDFIEGSGGKAYSKPVWVAQPENLQAVRIERVSPPQGEGDLDLGVAGLVQDAGSDWKRLRKLGVKSLRGEARPAKDGSLVIPFTFDDRLQRQGGVGFEIPDYECHRVELDAPLDDAMIHRLGPRELRCRMVGD